MAARIGLLICTFVIDHEFTLVLTEVKALVFPRDALVTPDWSTCRDMTLDFLGNGRLHLAARADQQNGDKVDNQ